MQVSNGNGSQVSSQVDLIALAARHAGGEALKVIAAELGWSSQALSKRLRNGMPGTKRSGRARVAQAAASATPAVTASVPASVPAASDSFVAPQWYALLKYAMTAEKGVTLFGPRGCGKSTAIRHLAAEVTRPTVTLQCAANMQLDALLGTWTSRKGTLTFIDGPLTTAVRTGAWLLAEEANVIHPGVWSAVNTLTDQTGEGLRLPTGEVVPAHPEFRLVLVYNEGYTGTKEVNAALKDRLMPVYCGYLGADEEAKLLGKLTGAPAEECERVRQVAEMIRTAGLRFDLSPRSLVRWIKLVKVAGLSWAEAYERAVMDLAGPPELAGPQRGCLTEIARNTVNQWPA